MGEHTEIAWCDATFNPWWGCQRVSPGCEHCYAEAFAKRVGFTATTTQAGGDQGPIRPPKSLLWGPESKAARRFFGDAHWAEPVAWNRAAAKEGRRKRVFCASMADVFEDRRELESERARLRVLIDETPNLDWLLLTKRPENVQRLWARPLQRNIWLGTTCEDQQRANERIPHLLSVPASVHFVSYEPALGPIDFGNIPAPGKIDRVDWIIVGGESGPRARPFDIGWARRTVEACRRNLVACFVKQLGSNPHGEWGDTNKPMCTVQDTSGHSWTEEYRYKNGRWRMRNAKGASPSEWPADLRVQEFPMDSSETERPHVDKR